MESQPFPRIEDRVAKAVKVSTYNFLNNAGETRRLVITVFDTDAVKIEVFRSNGDRREIYLSRQSCEHIYKEFRTLFQTETFEIKKLSFRERLKLLFA